MRLNVEAHHRPCIAALALVGLTLALVRLLSPNAVAKDESSPPSGNTTAADEHAKPEQRPHHTETIRGRVVWLATALDEHHGISTVPEASERCLAILTPAGEIIPILENVRGRAFRKDKRLREMDLDLLVRRHDRQPFVQILKVFEIDADKRFEVDYWCDVCAIVMFETGPCACCQDDNRLRKTLIEDDDE